MGKKISRSMALCLLGLLLCVAPAAAAQDAGWRFELTPYFWFISANADSTVGNYTASVDTSFSDIWENFDVVGAAARFEAWRGPWGFMVDGIYIKVDQDSTVQSQACRTVEALRFPHAFDPLARIYREHEDAAARTAALRAVARIDTMEAAEFLLNVFQHEGQVERRAATDALKKARGTMFLEVARGALPGLSSEVRGSLQEVFHARGESL